MPRNARAAGKFSSKNGGGGRGPPPPAPPLPGGAAGGADCAGAGSGQGCLRQVRNPLATAFGGGPSPPFRGRPDETSKDYSRFNRVLFAASDADSPPKAALREPKATERPLKGGDGPCEAWRGGFAARRAAAEDTFNQWFLSLTAPVGAICPTRGSARLRRRRRLPRRTRHEVPPAREAGGRPARSGRRIGRIALFWKAFCGWNRQNR